MSDLLIHSLSELSPLILEALRVARAKDVVEIGAEAGLMTRVLLEHTAAAGGTLTSIEPAPGPDVERAFQDAPNGRLVRATSLEAIGELAADAWLVDGDHNWFTVFHESEAIWARARVTGRPFLVFYHDVSWPCARRDLYYDPRRIPAEFLHPHSWDEGITLGDAGTVRGGFRGNGHWACARHEGGPRNGVLTAIEDFVEGKEPHLAWAVVPAVFGLGVLFASRAPWAGEMRALLAPFHQNPILERLESNRLECYLTVIAWQDQHAAAA